MSASGFSGCTTPAKKLGPVGFKFRRFDGRFWDHEMRGPDWTIVRSAKAAPGDKGVAIRQPLSFDEQLVEGGMRAICSVRCKSELDVTGQL